MSENKNEIEILKIMIEDEHHYRTMVQSRIAYHTSIILALIALSGALAVRASSHYDYYIISPLGILIAYISHQANISIVRLYDHFIEAIRAREEIEIILGIRDTNKEREKRDAQPRSITSKSSSGKYWPYNDALLFDSWVPKGVLGGYFDKTQQTFVTFFFIGILIFIAVIALGQSASPN